MMITSEFIGTLTAISAVGTFIASLAIVYILVRGRNSHRLEAKADHVSKQLDDESLPDTIRKIALAETVVALLVQSEIDRISELTYEEFLDELRNEYKFDGPLKRLGGVLGGVFNKKNLSTIGDKLLEKILGIINKAAGVPG